jgi:hypothetical protein
MSEAISSVLSPGAGRQVDYIWPDVTDIKTSVPILGRYRSGQTYSAINSQVGGVGSAIISTLAGRDCAQIFAGAANNTGAFYRFDGVCAHICTTRGPTIPPVCDPFRVWRYVAVMLFGNVPTADVDNGFQVCIAGGSGQLLRLGTTQGFGFVRTSDGRVSLCVRGPSLALTTIPLTSNATFDPTVWHAYEFRMIGATATQEAQLKVLIDNVLLATLQWGAGTLLPTSVIGNAGFYPAVICLSGTNAIGVAAFHAAAAISELAIL